MQNLAVASHTVRAHVSDPKNVGSYPWDDSVVDAIKAR